MVFNNSLVPLRKTESETYNVHNISNLQKLFYETIGVGTQEIAYEYKNIYCKTNIYIYIVQNLRKYKIFKHLRTKKKKYEYEYVYKVLLRT